MSQSFKVLVNKTYAFEIEEKDLEQFDAVPIGNQEFHILKNHQPFKAQLISSDFLSRKYSVVINNNTYQVVISNDLDILIDKIGIARRKPKVINFIKAPMPGLVIEISVEVGQEVKENDPLVILEAMKMENSFVSPRNGIIKSIAVTKGMAIEKGHLLIEFEQS